MMTVFWSIDDISQSIKQLCTASGLNATFFKMNGTAEHSVGIVAHLPGVIRPKRCAAAAMAYVVLPAFENATFQGPKCWWTA
jgi:hypothetical protein